MCLGTSSFKTANVASPFGRVASTCRTAIAISDSLVILHLSCACSPDRTVSRSDLRRDLAQMGTEYSLVRFNLRVVYPGYYLVPITRQILAATSGALNRANAS